MDCMGKIARSLPLLMKKHAKIRIGKMVVARLQFGYPSRPCGERTGYDCIRLSKNYEGDFMSLYYPLHFQGKIGTCFARFRGKIFRDEMRGEW